MNELKSCPFCGGEARTWNTPHVGGLHDCAVLDAFSVAVECSECHATTPGYMTEERAIEAWNTRAERTCHNADDHKVFWFICSECGGTERMAHKVGNYCPYCGARVEVEE